jgi:hypothetical protein
MRTRGCAQAATLDVKEVRVSGAAKDAEGVATDFMPEEFKVMQGEGDSSCALVQGSGRRSRRGIQ